jgi:hypothetical protein
MSKMIGTKVEIINGQSVTVKVFAPSRSDVAASTKPRFQKLNSGAKWLARDNGQIQKKE